MLSGGMEYPVWLSVHCYKHACIDFRRTCCQKNNGALRDIEQMLSGICKIGLFARLSKLSDRTLKWKYRTAFWSHLTKLKAIGRLLPHISWLRHFARSGGRLNINMPTDQYGDPMLRTQQTVVADLLLSVSLIIINLTLLKILTSNFLQC